MEQAAIIFENVTKSFDLKRQKKSKKGPKLESEDLPSKFVVLDKISFEIKKGETVGIIGLNGSGKTTLLRLISGIYNPDSGKIRTDGKIAPLLQIGIGFNNELNAEENIIFYGMLLGFTKSKIESKVDSILNFAGLEKMRNMKLGKFSNGMRARLGFATAVEVKADILLVDEVLSVGDEVFKAKCYKVFRDFKKNNKTIVFSSHSNTMIKDFSDRVILINSQKISKFAPPDEVLPRYKVIVTRHEEKRMEKHDMQKKLKDDEDEKKNH